MRLRSRFLMFALLVTVSLTPREAKPYMHCDPGYIWRGSDGLPYCMPSALSHDCDVCTVEVEGP